MRARVGKAIRRLGIFSVVGLAGFLAVVYVASFYAAPIADANGVDFSEEPHEVLNDAVHDLQTREYRYEQRYEATASEISTLRMVKQVVVDNGARRYQKRNGRIWSADRTKPADWTRSFSESTVGHLKMSYSDGTDDPWARESGYGYDPGMNAFGQEPSVPAGSVTVVAENESAVVYRISKTGVVTGLTGFSGVNARNLSASMRIQVSKPDGRIDWARVHGSWNDYFTGDVQTGRLAFSFSNYGATDIDRPLETYPPEPETILFRLSLGWDALASGGWVVVLLLGSSLVSSAFVAHRFVDWRPIRDRIAARTAQPRDRLPSRDSEAAPGWFRSALRGYTTVLAASWLCLLVLMVTATVIGPAPVTDDGPTVSADDPPAEVVADSLADLKKRPHVTEVWITETNETSGYYRHGIVKRLTLEPGSERASRQLWAGGFQTNTTPDDPAQSTYTIGESSWYEETPGDWYRQQPHAQTYTWISAGDVVHSATPLGRLKPSAVERNDSAMTVTYTSAAALGTFGISVPENVTARVDVVVALGPTPHVLRVIESIDGDHTHFVRTYRIQEMGSASVTVPEHVPATAERLVWRAERGLARIGSWVGL
ncbi:hypothetical protein [Haloarchaeobius sp. DFWS5]|uniref:hypothetical protein n=1 Tax=Haloarchaeobius sp. DFWS5 TaxID=3446114 RepID=UPI003EBC724E